MSSEPDPSVPRQDESQSSAAGKRPMVRSELLGQHTHATTVGVNVQIYRRNDNYLARGRLDRKRFGETLGAEVNKAVSRLRRLLVEIEDGSYVRPSERRGRPLDRSSTPRLTIRQLADEFLLDKRRVRGVGTASNYRGRLEPVIEFSERPESRRQWPVALDIDREFALQLKGFLHDRMTSRNGRPSAAETKLSATHIRNILDCARTMLSWGKKPANNKLPSYFANPIDQDIVGVKPPKDPLRSVPLPLETRAAIIAEMDLWQLAHFAIPFVLPLRPEDITGLLITEVDFRKRQFRFGTRFQGRDFNKGRQSFVCPFPIEIVPFLRICQGRRREGPLLRKRTAFDGRRPAKLHVNSTEDLATEIDKAFGRAESGSVLTPQDQKRLVRKTLRTMGGVSEDSLSKEFKALVQKRGEGIKVARFYDLRGSANTELNRSGASHLFQLYLTGHSTGEILNEYVPLDPHGEMSAYFRHIQPLLTAMTERGRQLGLSLDA